MDCIRSSSYCTTSAFLQTCGWQMTFCIDIKAVRKICRWIPYKGINSYFDITKPQSFLFVRLKWGLKTLFFFFLQNPKKSISQGMFYCTHQEHRAVLKNIGPQYTQMQSFILTPWMYLWKSRWFLVFKWIICCISDGYTEFSLILWLGCWKFLYAANTIGRYHHVFQSGFFQKCFIHQSYSKFRSKAVPSLSSKAYCCHSDKDICSVLYLEKLLLFFQDPTRSDFIKN